MTRRILLCLTAVILLAGCKIHEVPEGGDENGGAIVQLTLKMRFDKDLLPFQEVAPAAKADEAFTARYVVALYRMGEDGKTESIPAYVFVFREDDMEDKTFTVGVYPDDYKAAAWCDWVSPSTFSYTSPAFEIDPNDESVDDAVFSEVSLVADPYLGGSPWRDAFFGVEDLRLSFYLANYSEHTAGISLKRANAQFRFIATDKDEFIKYWTSKGSYDFQDIGVKISYPQFLPSTFNVLAEKPVDSISGVSFWAEPVQMDDGTVNLGYDWVFANEDQTSVVVALSFYDAAGKFISTIPNIVVPLCRGKVTTIRGAILTNGVDSGISIDPGFDGEIVVHI